jgi:hypothetical protein
MAKKVIDIIPPKSSLLEREKEDKPQKRSDDLSPAGDAVQEPSPEQKLEIKPRITFVAGKDDHQKKKGPSLPSLKKNLLKGWGWKLILAAVVVAAAMYAWDMRFAKAVIKVWPATSELKQETKVIVDTAVQTVDESKSLIPGFAISVENTINGEFPVTGTKNVQGKAQGVVKIFNNYTASQRLVKGTRLQAPLEKFQPELAKDETPWFRTTEDVVIEPKSSATVKVVADNAGEKYNINPSVFSVPGLVGTAQYTFIYGQSFEKFQGGTQGNASEVKKEDLENAKTAMAGMAKERIKKELEAKVKEQRLEIIDESAEKFEFQNASTTAAAGDSLPKIAMSMKARATTVAYKRSDLESLAKDFIFSKMPAGSSAYEKSLSITSSYAGIDPATGRPALAAAAKVMVYSMMAENDLKKGLSEKGVEESKIFLMNQPGMKEAKIELTPPWRVNIPRALDRIEVQTILE